MNAARRAGAAALAGVLALLAGGFRLGTPGLWIDEIYTARWTRLDTAGLLAALRSDLHPPLFFLLEGVVARAGGGSEIALRLLPLLAGAAGAAFATWAFAPSLGERRAFVAGLAIALAPQFFLYARMARYYSLAALMVVLAHGAFERLAANPRGARWRLAYALAGAAVLWTSYAAGVVLLAHGMLAWSGRRERPDLPLAWKLSIGGSALLFAPWLPVLAAQLHVEHALTGAAGGFAAPLAMAAYAAWAFSAGELLTPWSLGGVLAALIAAIVIVAGIRSGARDPESRLPVRTGLLSFALAIALFGVFVRGTPFVVFLGRALFLWPFLAATIAGARVRPSLLVALAAAWTLAWAHLYTAHNWLDPLYLTPGREVAGVIRAAGRPGDLVLAEDDTGVPWYLARGGFEGRVIDPVDSAAVAGALATGPPRLWYARLSRDGSSRVRSGDAAAARIAEWGTLAERRGFLAADPRERALKRRLLGLEGWQWRVVLERREAPRRFHAPSDSAGTSGPPSR